MSKIKPYVTLFVFLLMASFLRAADNGRRYFGEHLSAINGLPRNTIKAIAQDEDGFIWVGGKSGLGRYDGYQFVNYPTNRMSGHTGAPLHVGNIHLDRYNHLLWVTTSTFVNACYDLRRGRFVDYTGCGDMERTYRKTRFRQSSILMGSQDYGFRLVKVIGGHFTHHDFTVANHSLRSDAVREIALDRKGNFWAATDKGIARIDTFGHLRLLYPHTSFNGCYRGNNVVLALSKAEQAAYLFNPDGRLLVRTTIPSPLGHLSAIRGCISWQGRWLVFTDTETFTIDQHTGHLSKEEAYQIPKGSKQSQCGDLQFVSNKSGNLWIFPRRGQMRCLKLVAAMPFSSEKQGLFKVVRGNDGLYYIASYGADLFVYDYQSNRLEHFTAEDPGPVIQSDYLYTIAKDRSGCIWIGQEDMGLTRLSKTNSLLATYFIDDQRQGDKTNNISTIFETTKGSIQLFTNQRKQFTFYPGTGTFSAATATPYIIYDRITDRKGHTWEATRGQGVFVDGNNTWLRFPHPQQKPMLFLRLRLDKQGRTWMGSWDGGLFYALPGKPDAVSIFTERVSDLALLPDMLCVGTLNGLYVGNIAHRRVTARDFVNYSPVNGLFPADEIVCLLPGKGRTLWVGTEGGGLLRCDFSHGMKKMSWKALTTREGLTSNNIRSLAADRRGYIWAGTESGLCRINPKTLEVSQFYDEGNLRANIFSDRCALTLRNGDMAFGTRNGLIIVNPRTLHNIAQRTPSRVTITNMDINGISLYEGLDSTLLDAALHQTHEIKLPHDVNALTIHFSDFNFRNIHSQVYQYSLEGVDANWHPGSNEGKAVYTNLDPGKYVFHVRAMNLQKAGPEATLTIVIRQPWYNTWWAWTFYLLAASLLFGYIYRNAQERIRLHRKMREEQQLIAYRTNLFTHIAHEFRIPLAIISNAVEKIAHPQGSVRVDIQMAQRGTRRLLRLVNQLLNFRKLESSNMKLHVEKDDIVPFLEQIFSDLWGLAHQKRITYVFTPQKKHMTLVFDHDLVETIVYNLLSNAVKYTQEGGQVTLQVSGTQEHLTITVEDNGPGLTAEQQTKLFKPFLHGEVSRGGMGIGLYTAYQSARLHHGCLVWKSATPYGSVFTLSLPMDDNCYAPEEYVARRENNPQDNAQSKQADLLIREIAPQALNDQCVAIIEDDPDMMEQINREIQPYFRTRCFGNGQSALDGLAEQTPSLVLCDIMLPDMTGYDIVKKMRKSAATATTPVILLTALDDESHQIKGYQAGADDYMVKTCNFHILIARMISLIKWKQERDKQAELAAHTAQQDATQPSAPSAQILGNRADLYFRQQLEAIVGKHIDDPTLNVDKLAEQMHIGRTRFYGKVKEIFGISPNKYIANRRLETAASLLIEGKYNVTEVAYKVGFTDPAYFYKCFKQKYGVMPSKYKG